MAENYEDGDFVRGFTDPAGLEADKTPPEPPRSVSAFVDGFRAPARAYLEDAAKRDLPWETVRSRLAEDSHEATEQTAEAYKNLRTGAKMDLARRKVAGAGESVIGASIQFAPWARVSYGMANSLRTARARARIEKGEADEADFDLVAESERVEQIEKERSGPEKAIRSVLGVPAMLVEFGGGSAVAKAALGGTRFGRAVGLAGQQGFKGAGYAPPSILSRAGVANAVRKAPQELGHAATVAAFTPTYFEAAAKRAEINGGEIWEPKNMGVAMLHHIVSLAFVGHTLKLTAGMKGLPRAAAGGLVGASEQMAGDVGLGAIDEVLPDAYKTNTRYGAIGKMARGDVEEGMWESAGHVLSFAALGALHKKPSGPLFDKYAKAVDHLTDTSSGGKSYNRKSADAYLAQLGGRLDSEIKRGATLTKEKALQTFEGLPEGPVKEYADALADMLPKREELTREQLDFEQGVSAAESRMRQQAQARAQQRDQRVRSREDVDAEIAALNAGDQALANRIRAARQRGVALRTLQRSRQARLMDEAGLEHVLRGDGRTPPERPGEPPRGDRPPDRPDAGPMPSELRGALQEKYNPADDLPNSEAIGLANYLGWEGGRPEWSDNLNARAARAWLRETHTTKEIRAGMDVAGKATDREQRQNLAERRGEKIQRQTQKARERSRTEGPRPGATEAGTELRQEGRPGKPKPEPKMGKSQEGGRRSWKLTPALKALRERILRQAMIARVGRQVPMVRLPLQAEAKTQEQASREMLARRAGYLRGAEERKARKELGERPAERPAEPESASGKPVEVRPGETPGQAQRREFVERQRAAREDRERRQGKERAERQERIRQQRRANLKQIRVKDQSSLEAFIRKNGGVSPESWKELGLDVEAAKENLGESIFRDPDGRKSTRHIDDVIPELVRAGELDVQPGEHPHDALRRKLERGAKSIESIESPEGQRAAEAGLEQSYRGRFSEEEMGKEGEYKPSEEEIPPAPPTLFQGVEPDYGPKVSGRMQGEINQAIESIPLEEQQLFRGWGGKVVIADFVTDAFPHLKGKKPRGWEEGKTWDNADGLFDIETKTVAVAEHYNDWHQKNFLMPGGKKTRTWRAKGTFRHEFGHGIDMALAEGTGDRRFSESEAFGEAYKKDVAKIDPALHKRFGYYLQEGVAGRQEAFAELYGQLRGGGGDYENIMTHFPESVRVIQQALRRMKDDGVSTPGAEAGAGVYPSPPGGRGEARGHLPDDRAGRELRGVQRGGAAGDGGGEARAGAEVGGRGADAGEVGPAPAPPWVLSGWDKFKAFWKAGNAGALPAQNLDTTNVLPRLQSNSVAKSVFSDPAGAGRVPGLAALMDRRGVERTPDGIALITRQAIKGIGERVAAGWAAMNKKGARVFRADPGGQITLQGGKKGYMADEIEAHMRGQATDLTPEQKDWVDNVWTPVLRDAQRMMRDEGVAHWMDANDVLLTPQAVAYFPRPAIGKTDLPAPSGAGRPPRGASKPGSKAFFQKSRQFQTEADGVTSPEKLVYDPDAASRAAKFIAGTYRAIGDHRLANDPDLGGRTDTNYVWLRERPVHVAPAFAGKVYPTHIADRIESAYGQGTPDWLAKLEKATAASKALMLAMDMSAPFVQGLPMMFSNPVRWARATGASYRALFEGLMGRDAEVAPAILRSKADSVKEFTQLGGSLARLSDHMSGLNAGEFATKIPVLGRGYEATGRAFGAFLDVAKLEMWEAWKGSTPPEQRAKMVETIENWLGSARMEDTGMSPQRAAAERLFLLAPAYYRSFVNNVATAFQRGVPGKMVRGNLAKMLGGMVGTSVGAMLAVGLGWDEIGERLDPTKGKFLKVPVRLGDGKTVEVGLGNIYSSVTRLMGEGYEHFSSDQPISTGTDGNPVLRWLRGKAAFFPRLVVDMVTGKDYLGNRVGVGESVVKSFEPLAVQQLLHGEGGAFQKSNVPEQPGRQNMADALVSFFGGQSYPGSAYDARNQWLDQFATRTTGRRYNDLSIPEQFRVMAAAQRSGLPQKPPASPAGMERAFAMAKMRSQSLRGKVSDQSRALLDEFAKELPSYESSLRYQNVEIPLGAERAALYENLLAEEYERTISRWQADRLRRAQPAARDAWMREQLEKAKERAKSRLIRESSLAQARR